MACGRYLVWLLPPGYADTHSAEDVRKFTIVQGIAAIMTASHLAILFSSLVGLNVSSAAATASTFFATVIALALVLEAVVLVLLRRNWDVSGAALLLVFTINASTLALCLHYGVVAELYIWLGWCVAFSPTTHPTSFIHSNFSSFYFICIRCVCCTFYVTRVPKILSLTHGGHGGLVGLVVIMAQGVAFYFLPSVVLVPPLLLPACGSAAAVAALVEIDQAARLLNVNAYLLCFGLTTAVHEYCRANELHQLRVHTTDTAPIHMFQILTFYVRRTRWCWWKPPTPVCGLPPSPRACSWPPPLTVLTRPLMYSLQLQMVR
jgi:hypothetical protein